MSIELTSVEYRLKYKDKDYTVEYWRVGQDVKIAVRKDDADIANYQTYSFGDKDDAIALLRGALKPRRQKF